MNRAEVLEAGFAEPSLPRVNGSPVFDAPWQARAHAMAVLLVQKRGHAWDDFRQLLIAAIAEEPERPYWDSWVIALEGFASREGIVVEI